MTKTAPEIPKVGMKQVYRKKYWSNSTPEIEAVRTVLRVGKAFIMFDDGSKLPIKHWTGPSSPAEIKKAEERIQFLKDWGSAWEEDRQFDLKKRRHKYSLNGFIEINLEVRNLVIAGAETEITLEDLPPEVANAVSELGFKRPEDSGLCNTLKINGQKFFLKSYGGQSYTFERAKA